MVVLSRSLEKYHRFDREKKMVNRLSVEFYVLDDVVYFTAGDKETTQPLSICEDGLHLLFPENGNHLIRDEQKIIFSFDTTFYSIDSGNLIMKVYTPSEEIVSEVWRKIFINCESLNVQTSFPDLLGTVIDNEIYLSTTMTPGLTNNDVRPTHPISKRVRNILRLLLETKTGKTTVAVGALASTVAALGGPAAIKDKVWNVLDINYKRKLTVEQLLRNTVVSIQDVLNDASSTKQAYENVLRNLEEDLDIVTKKNGGEQH